MLIKFICCDVFARIACDLVAKSPHIVDLEFVPMMSHVEPGELKLLIEESIDKSVNHTLRKYDVIILGFGLCGNSTIGLSAPIPMVIPRAHDCCTLLMGSKERFIEAFGTMLSARWGATGYFERTYGAATGYPTFDQMANYKTSKEYMDLVEQYDEETAEYLWETLHPAIEVDESFYINMEGYEYSGAYDWYKQMMDERGVKVNVVEGDTSFLKALVDGEWDDERFLVLQPGERIAGVYDMDQVLRADAAGEAAEAGPAF